MKHWKILEQMAGDAKLSPANRAAVKAAMDLIVSISVNPTREGLNSYPVTGWVATKTLKSLGKL